MKLRWTPEAKADLAQIIEFIWSDNPGAARRMRVLIRQSATRLERHPMIGRPGAQFGTRELTIHPNYRLVYEIRGDFVWINAVVHNARQWPPEIEDGQ